MSRTLFVPGIPAAQGSKRHVGGGRMVEMSKRLKPWRATIAAAVIDAGWATDPILTGPVSLTAAFLMPRPKHHYRTGRNAQTLKANAPVMVDKAPDLDKLVRAVCDALTQAGAWRDDSQVAEISTYKRYIEVGEEPGVRISVGRVNA